MIDLPAGLVDNRFDRIAGGRLVQQLLLRKPPELEVLCCEIEDHCAELHPLEASAVARAVDKRRFEFATGRWLAQRALARLGLPSAPIPMGAEREPVWPGPVVASLSHSHPICVLAMARAQAFKGVGIDIELAPMPDAEVRRSLLAAGESERFGTPELLRLAFSAKEAVFKCQFAAHRRFIDYPEVAIELDPASRTFTAVARTDGLDALRLEDGRGIYELDDDGALTLFVQAGDRSA